ncbi:MAG: serine carboxypeptidase [Lasallia pustulata]|uniref:Carboxypeptidase n=1 Tax=Lasallia pustulata TaxID=136370 RepID=A0A5M8PLH8_9LECA|nr:MAG: serine carboxypeptidase [Lasallia pustulata]
MGSISRVIFALLHFLTVVIACGTENSPNIAASLGTNATRFAVGNLPDLGFELPQSWAGQISVPGTTNDELFFWLFAAEDQSLSDDLIIWLNGGPGCSSLDGLTSENGPLAFYANLTVPNENPYSWTKLANVVYIDQPVGTGYSDGSDQAATNAQVTADFYSWLTAFYEVFPALKSKGTHLTGESYAGVFIPYFAQAILVNQAKLELNLKSIAIGDGSIGNYAAMTDVTAVEYLEEHNMILGLPNDILTTLKDASQACGFTDVLGQLSYPPKGKIVIPGNPEDDNFKRSVEGRQASNTTDSCNINPTTAALVNSTIYGTCYGGCATWSAAADYLTATRPCFSVYNIEYICANFPSTTPFTEYLSLPGVREAIHAPNKTFADCNVTILDTLALELVTPPAYSLIPSILEAGIPIHLYSGDYDLLLNHIGTELVIQNMTWCGKQGFQSPPDKNFTVDGQVAGNWGYERGLSYHHILHAGHAVPHDQPASAFAFVRDFVVGDAGYR